MCHGHHRFAASVLLRTVTESVAFKIVLISSFVNAFVSRVLTFLGTFTRQPMNGLREISFSSIAQANTDPARANPYVSDGASGSLRINEAVRPLLDLFGRQCCGAGVREIALQPQEHGAPAINRRCGRLSLPNPPFNFKARELFGPFIRPMLATGAPGEQCQRHKEIARYIT